MSDYEELRAQWAEQELKKATARIPERDLLESPSKPAYARLYGPSDGHTDPVEDLGVPGRPPFTRGAQPTMYRAQFWTMRQYAGFSSPEESNARYRYLLDQGTTGLSVAFDLPTQIGLDCDHPEALGEVGRVGVPVGTRADMQTLFEGIPLDKVSTSMTINSTAFILLALYVVEGERQGVERNLLRGTIQNDILKEYIARGTYIYPPSPSMKIVADTVEFCSQDLPKFNPISISGYHIREAGSTAAQEIAYTLADGLAYVQAAVDRGLDVDSFAPRLSFFFNSQMDFLEEVAKFRAARRLWSRLMTERFQPKKPQSLRLRFHAQTAGSALTAKEPDVNVTRVTLQALAAVLGGCQSLHTNSWDEALGLPTEDSVRVALRTQQVIAHESRVGDTIDPLGGSYAIEAMTERLEVQARELIAKLDALGGVLPAIEEGYIQGEITRAAYEFQKDLESGARVQVGVTRFADTKETTPPETLRLDPALETRQVEKIQAFRAQRDAAAAGSAQENLRKAAVEDRNLMPPTIEAIRSGVTMGEIADTLRKVYGLFQGG
jgi:methylmalonyl-CoA mutase N-terminal domain/subunit